jgi:hypothetical protein
MILSVVIFKDSNDKWICHYWAATTDAGTYWLIKADE